jgi:hypothetical protein
MVIGRFLSSLDPQILILLPTDALSIVTGGEKMVVRFISQAAEVAIFLAAATLLVVGVLKVC